MAVCELKDNRGTLRKEIWAYLYEQFRNSVEYRDFLLSISNLEKSGLLTNKQGFFFVQNDVYTEMVTQYATKVISTPPKSKAPTPKLPK